MTRKKDKEPKDETALLKAVQALVEAERSLTAVLEEAEPWLSSSNSGSASSRRGPFVRPLPSNMEQVDQVLAVARNLAARTSAPAGWNPPAPVVGFATPNPLPHQLRGGALGSLQLERAREQLQKEQSRKRQRQQEEEVDEEQTKSELVGDQKTKARASQELPTEAMQVDTDDSKIKDPKRKEVVDYEKQLARPEEDLSSSIHKRREENERRQSLIPHQQQQEQQRVMNADMNLSDSSSSEEGEDEE